MHAVIALRDMTSSIPKKLYGYEVLDLVRNLITLKIIDIDDLEKLLRQCKKVAEAAWHKVQNKRKTVRYTRDWVYYSV